MAVYKNNNKYRQNVAILCVNNFRTTALNYFVVYGGTKFAASSTRHLVPTRI